MKEIFYFTIPIKYLNNQSNKMELINYIQLFKAMHLI